MMSSDGERFTHDVDSGGNEDGTVATNESPAV